MQLLKNACSPFDVGIYFVSDKLSLSKRCGRKEYRIERALSFSLFSKQPGLVALIALEWQGASSNAQGLKGSRVVCLLQHYGSYSFHFGQSGPDLLLI